MSTEGGSESSIGGYLPALDGLRAIAVTLVLWHHTPLIFLGGAKPGAFLKMSSLGWAGVDLFFVLSGFLITTILLRSRGRERALRSFWARRALRILPLSLLYLVLLLLFGMFDEPYLLRGIRNPEEWPWYFFFMTNLRIVFLGPPGGGLNLLWSLAVEEQFYLVWPLLVFSLSKGALLSVALGIVALSPLARLATADAFGRTYPEVFFAPWCRFDVIAVGAAIAILMSSPGTRTVLLRWSHRLVIPAVLGLLAIAALPLGDSAVPDPRRMLPFVAVGYSFIALAFGVVLVAVLEPGWMVRRVLASPVFVWIGRRSFGIYIWHTLVGTAIVGSVQEFGIAGATLPVAVAIWVPLTLAVAEVSWRFYERPILSLKERFTPG